MPMKRLIYCFLSFIALMSLTLTGCMSKISPPKKPLILVSASPYETVVQNIAGDSVTVTSIIPSNVDPHTWEPRPNEVTPFVHAKIWFTIGEDFEPNLAGKLQSTNRSMKIINLASAVSNPISLSGSHACCKHSHADIDTHFWLDPLILISQAKLISQELTKLLPGKKALFQKNLHRFENKMEKLNKRTQKELTPFAGKILITTHGAFAYYCRQYHLDQISLEPGAGKEPGGRDVTNILQRVEEEKEKIVGVLLEPQHENMAAERIAAATNLPTLMINPHDPDFISTIKTLTNFVVSHE